VAMFLKITFLEGKRRKSFFEKCPPSGYGCQAAA
jgi:hypothetical protein